MSRVSFKEATLIGLRAARQKRLVEIDARLREIECDMERLRVERHQLETECHRLKAEPNNP